MPINLPQPISGWSILLQIHSHIFRVSEEYECIKIDPNVDPLLLLSQCADTPEGLIAFLKQFSVDNAA